MPREITVELKARDLRFFRAVRDVLSRYRIEPAKQQKRDGLIWFDVRGGREDYTVMVDPVWIATPACTCRDASRYGGKRNAGFCKHVIAVLLRDEHLRCQLIDLLL